MSGRRYVCEISRLTETRDQEDIEGRVTKLED